MSKRDIKSYTCLDGNLKNENEPEEGEIIDDYDLIISSDEELSMRQRILELEAENEEIEQIAVISRSYVDKINHPHNHLESNRAAQVPTDVSSISSTEFVTPQKRKRRKSKEHKRKHCHRQHPREHHDQYDQNIRYDVQKLPQKIRSKKAHCKRRQKLCAKKHKKLQSDRFSYKDLNVETLSLDSFESSDSSSIADTDNYGTNCVSSKRKTDAFNKGKYITRDTLRMAVARNTNESISISKKYCLKDKLLGQDLVGQSSKNDDCVYVKGPEFHDDNDEDDDVQVIENEPDIQTIDEDSTDSMEEKELRLIALKSAVLNKHNARQMRNAEVAYSPTDFDEMQTHILADSKMDDIDIVDLEAEDSQPACVTVSPEASPQLIMLDDQEESQQLVDCKPVDMDIANSDSEDATIDSWGKDVESSVNTYCPDSFDFAKNSQFDFYMQKLQELPPPPPGVDDYEEIPPPPPYHMIYDADIRDMDLDNEDFTEAQQNKEENETYTSEHKESLVSADFETNEGFIKQEKEEDEEEEEALRALLLSKFQSPKNHKKLRKRKEIDEEKDISKVNENHCKPKPTEIILKEAVKRLKIHSQADPYKEENTALDSNVEENGRLIDKPREFSENSSEIVFEKLRDRLNTYKKQSHLNTDQSKCNEDSFTCENNEFSANSNSDTSSEHTEMPNSCEIRSTIDISDITRRLQIIKENVLKSTNKIIPKEHPISCNFVPKQIETSQTPSTHFDISTHIQEPNETSLENGFLPCAEMNTPTTRHMRVKVNLDVQDTHEAVIENVLQPKRPIANDFIHNGFGEINTPITRHKTVKVNLDVQGTNETAIENVPQPNRASTNDTINDVTEDKGVNSKNKIVKANFDANTNQTTFKITIKNNTSFEAETNDVEHSSNEVHNEHDDKNVPKNLLLKLNTNKSKAGVSHERIVKTTNKTIKSNALNNAKTNKPVLVATSVANDKIASKAAQASIRATKIVKPNKVINKNFDLNQNLSSKTTQSFTVAKPSKSEARSDSARLITSMDQVKYMCKVAPFVISLQNSSNESSEEEMGEACNALYKPLYDYNDNASPLSLILESPSITPLRSNSPIAASVEGGEDVKKEAFGGITSIETQKHKETTVLENTPQNERTNKTPLAVRHLPAAAQSEYRRLIHRMKLLENKRKLTDIEEHKKENISNENSSSPLVDEINKEKLRSETASSATKISLVKTVLLKNASNKTTPTATANNDTHIPNKTPKLHKGNVLRSYESLYAKFGAGIVNNLDKSLKLVEEAKRAKIAKLKLENRIKELKTEMDVLQSKHKEEQQKISRIYPSICTTNEVITSLKQKRSKVYKAALNLGKTVKGDVYRLNNDLKEIITTKSKKLATEIKTVNSLKVQDIKNAEELMNSESNECPPMVEKKLKEIEDRKGNLEEEKNVEIAFKNNEKDCAESSAEKAATNTLEPLLKTEICGNTENSENNDLKQPEKDENSCEPDLNTIHHKKDSEQTLAVSSYISPLEHLRNIDSNMDPNGVVCPYDLMGNCEDVTCKYVHITSKKKT